MRIKNLLFGAFVAVVATSGMMTIAAAQQTFSEISFAAFESDAKQSRFDPSGFDSALWRSEYLWQASEDDLTGKESQGNSSPTEDVTDVRPLPATKGPNDAPERKKDAQAAISYSNGLITMPIDVPTAMESRGLTMDGNSHDAPNVTMSDWEKAVFNSAGKSTLGFTASGPSVTSAIVGFVGTMIVIGAYVSSGKRNR